MRRSCGRTRSWPHCRCAQGLGSSGHTIASSGQASGQLPGRQSEARKLLQDAEGCIVVDHRANEGYVTPHEVAGEDAVYISRIRKDPTVDNGLVFWCVSDNLRKGAALNSVQIAELVVERDISGR